MSCILIDKMGDNQKRGRSKFLSGNEEWLRDTINQAIQNLKPGDRVELEFFRFIRPENLYGIRVKPGKTQQETMERLGGTERR